MIRIASDALEAIISPHGAELQSLRDRNGLDYLWDGDPAYWTGRSPLLFPVIGVMNAGEVRVDGCGFPMPKHGIARHRSFATIDLGVNFVNFGLDADDETRAAYPFEFRLDIAFTIAGSTLEMAATLANRGTAPMPASFGFHPAFRWPLPGGTREHQRLRFDHPEREPIRRIDRDGLLIPTTFPTPVEGDALALREDLFVDDAIIFDGLWSRAATLESPGARSLRIEWPNLPMLGVWTKPGAGFICVEPWQGIADPQGYAGELRDKPGVVEIAPGATRTFRMSVTLL